MKTKQTSSPFHDHHQERRRFSRVTFDRSAWLTIPDKRQHFEQVGNLSMGGAYIQGRSSFKAGDTCYLELHDNGRHSCRVVRFCARILRAGDGCLALEFVDMDTDSYMFLQTMILYGADDPLGVVTEFQDDFPRSALSGTC
jgi:hypothetical protein